MNAARWLLLPLSLLYGVAMRIRNLHYSRRRRAAQRAAVPVISVGNIAVGGTGKTPLVIEVVRRLQAMGRRPAVLTRGYKGTSRCPADEVLELREAMPGIPVIVNRDRATGADEARSTHQADCVVLDDGFQHRRLARDLDIVLIDALNPWGGGAVLPAGRLREPLTGLRRADVLVITRTNQLPAPDVAEIETRLRRLAGDKPIWRAAVEAEAVVYADGRTVPPTDLALRRVFAVCGLGNPETFPRLLDALDAQPVGHLAFADHHDYRPADVERIDDDARRAGAELVVTTRKDWVKLMPLWPGERLPLARVDIRLAWQGATAEIDARLRQAVESRG